MIFPTASQTPRPVRLKETTRAGAWESLHGKYGDEAIRTPAVPLDDVPDFECLSEIEKYDVAIRRIAERAPVRLCPQERVCGAATLGNAMCHTVPATYRGKPVCDSVSHLTIRYDKVLRQGLDAYAEDVKKRLEDKGLRPKQVAFLHSLENVIGSMRIWHARYLAATEKSRPDLHQLLKQVPFSPARSFHEALQSLWFVFSFVRLCGNWPGIGRLDWLLGDYLSRDLADGTLDMDEARELLASFFIKGCEWILSDTPVGSGDAQHYQNIVLAGVDENGREITNEVTFLALDVVEELAISDFPIALRLSQRTPHALKARAAEVMRHGGGIVAMYNEDLVLRALDSLGYPPKEARHFANDGCWEVQIPGKTDFGYMPFDALQLLNKVLGVTGERTPSFDTIEALYSAFLSTLRQTVDALYRDRISDVFAHVDGIWQAKKRWRPSSVVSLFEDGCIENAASYCDFGPRYVVRSPHIGGAPDVANSLYAIEKLVFEEKKLSLSALVRILKDNWEGHETLRAYVRDSYSYYGNDTDESDAWHARLLNDFADIVAERNAADACPVKFIPGVSTFGRQISWAPQRAATAFGYKKGEILSGNDSPVPGTDSAGVTAIIKSYCKADLVRQSCGAALDVKIFPSSLDGDNGIVAPVALMDAFVKLGGFFLQLDAVDTQTLLEAQKDPLRYKTLSVRVAGWNARFVTLDKEWQDMIIERSLQHL